MAEALDDDEVFVYMGGDQQVPDEVRRARIHKSVKIIRARAFYWRQHLISVEFHDGVEIIEEEAFYYCDSLRSAIKLLGVKIIKAKAFFHCHALTDVEFGDKLETIEQLAFTACNALTKIRMPSVTTIGDAFGNCLNLFDVEFGEALMTLGEWAFTNCPKLKRIALPLRSNMIRNHVFEYCPMLTTVDLVGGINHTIASLHMESWRNEMNIKINSINEELPTLRYQTSVIEQWMRLAAESLDYYKDEHKAIVKEATTLLELALWKANLDGSGGGEGEREGVRTTRGSRKRARKESCVTSGADVVIKNVLPFLQLLE